MKHARIYTVFLLLALGVVQTAVVHASTTYYIGGDVCDDVGEGSEDTPFCTMTVAQIHLQAGDTLQFVAGVYAERVIIEDIHGMSDAPITIRGVDTESVIFEGGCADFPCDITAFNWAFAEADVSGWDLSWELDGFISVRDSTHLILSNVTVQNVATEGIHIEGGANIVVENTVINGIGNAGIIAQYGQDITIRNNHLENIQLGYIDHDGNPAIGYHEALSIVGVDRFDVSGNQVRFVIKEGIDIKESSANGSVRDNIVEYVCAVGIYINEAQSVTVDNNYIARTGYLLGDDGELPCGTHPIYGEAFGDYYGDAILIAVGDLGDVSTGQLSDVTLYTNIIDTAYGNCIQTWDETNGSGDMRNVQIINNTLYACGGFGMLLDSIVSSQVVNNIIAQAENDALAGNTLADNDVSHNLIWENGNEQLFMDVDSGDFRLDPNSLAIDAGRLTQDDFNGEAPDIGAIEYEGDA